ncbi:MAG: response regulator [Bacteroidetes bacterium]|nr:response regulator [Bacteroidota bacterium]MBU1115164.1 response regulator [Bacteroidota bacterium]MBU1799335.1 response regulator [Bacteroidota bacterium]
MDLKFLVVDDSVTMRRIVVNSLKGLGYSQFLEASDGKEAIDVLNSDDSITFVITDWNMPNVSGLDLVKSIRAHPKYSTIPILMVTTRGVKDDIMEALHAKVNNYVIKPFTPQILKEKIEQILASR